MAVIGCWKNSFPAQIHTATLHNCSQIWLVSTYHDACLISTRASDNGEKNKTQTNTKQPKHGIWAQAKEALIHLTFPASDIPSAPWPHSAFSHPCLLQSEGFPASSGREEALFDFTFCFCYLLSAFFSLPPCILGAPVAFYTYAHGTWLTSAEELSLSIVPASRAPPLLCWELVSKQGTEFYP